jgi:uncharacterized circularly permuted ATP-grasp superfamily protein
LTWYHKHFISEKTKTDKYDILNIPDGFSYVAKNRKIFKHKFGGIVVVYRNNLKNHIKFKYFQKISSGSEKSSKTAVLALKSPTSAHFMSFSIKYLKMHLLTNIESFQVNVEDGLFIYHIAMTTKFYLIIIFP